MDDQDDIEYNNIYMQSKLCIDTVFGDIEKYN